MQEQVLFLRVNYGGLPVSKSRQEETWTRFAAAKPPEHRGAALWLVWPEGGRVLGGGTPTGGLLGPQLWLGMRELTFCDHPRPPRP